VPDATPDPERRPRPADLSEAELGFARQQAVRWLSPAVLVGTGVKALLATIFGSYADKRELQAVLPARLHRHDDGEELWFDFVADVGDGFDPTYSVALLLAAPTLPVSDGPTAWELPRGRLLILGGDEVYPVASTRGYEDRTKGPYRAALPEAAAPQPVMFALPGNHDWYDGLTSFLRVFTQGRPIGGWVTEQSRSYFAIQLPHRWWLYAVDAQLSAYIDAPQLEYFRQAAEELQPGDAVILCWPTPAWVTTDREPSAYDPIEFFDAEIVRPRGASIRVMLSGDSHHYARYAEVGGTGARITCGVGGAYLIATHRLPETLQVPSPQSRMLHRTKTQEFALRTRYPDKESSRKLSLGIMGLAWRNPGFWPLMGGIQTLLMIALLFAVYYGQPGGGLANLQTLRGSFTCLLLAAAYLALAVLFARLDRGSPRRAGLVAGLIHGAAHLLLGAGWTAVVVEVLRLSRPRWLPDPVLAAAIVVVTFVAVGLLATLLTGLYLLIASQFEVNLNEAFAGQSIENRKGFLRLHIGTDGGLTVYPVKLPKVCHDWQVNQADDPGQPWVRPARGPLQPELIEAPIRVPHQPGTP
jgi:hypothetical protein